MRPDSKLDSFPGGTALSISQPTHSRNGGTPVSPLTVCSLKVVCPLGQQIMRRQNLGSYNQPHVHLLGNLNRYTLQDMWGGGLACSESPSRGPTKQTTSTGKSHQEDETIEAILGLDINISPLMLEMISRRQDK
jgi:hypothetical protein